MTERDKVTVDDIIGLVDCEPTNSVEEVKKLRGRENRTEKRYNVYDVDGTIFLEDHKEGSYHIGQVGNVDINCLNDIANRLNELTDENEKLKQDLEEYCNFSLHDVLDKKNKEIEQLEHQLHSLNGLWASDKEDMSYPFRLEFKELQE